MACRACRDHACKEWRLVQYLVLADSAISALLKFGSHCSVIISDTPSLGFKILRQ